MIGYPKGWIPGYKNNDRKTQQKGSSSRPRGSTEQGSGPRAALAGKAESPIPGLSHEQYAKLLQYLGGDEIDSKSTTQQPNVNMASKFMSMDRSWIVDLGVT